MLEESCEVEGSGVNKGLEETLSRKRARNMLLKLKIETIRNKFSEFRSDDAEGDARKGAEARQELDPYNFTDEDYEVRAHSVKVKDPTKQPCPHCGVEVIHLQSHMRRKHLEHYKKGKGGLKRKRRIRTTCFECELSMDEEDLGSHWTKQHCSSNPQPYINPSFSEEDSPAPKKSLWAHIRGDSSQCKDGDNYENQGYEETSETTLNCSVNRDEDFVNMELDEKKIKTVLYSNNMEHYCEQQSSILEGGTEAKIKSTHDCTEQAGLMHVKNETGLDEAGLGEEIKVEIQEEHGAERCIFLVKTSEKSFRVNVSSKAQVSKVRKLVHRKVGGGVELSRVVLKLGDRMLADGERAGELGLPGRILLADIL